jgi:hypothetical protein
MIRFYDRDEPFADVDLVDGKMVFTNVTGDRDAIVDGIEFVRRGRSDTELYHSLPEIFHGQCWAEHVNPFDEPGPDDEIVEPPGAQR